MRLDKYLIENNYFSSRNRAQNEIKNGNILILNILRMVNGHRHVKIVKLLLKMSICQRKEISVFGLRTERRIV